MNSVSIIITVVFFMLIALGFMMIGTYNKLLFLKNKTIDKFSTINNSIKERIEISTKIANILKNGSYNEDNLVLTLNKLSKEIDAENEINNLISLIDKSNKILKKSLSLDGLYEKLKTNKEYNDLIEEFKNNQDKIIYAKEIYNTQAKEYNNYKNKSVVKLVSTILKYEDYNYYQNTK